MKATFTETCRTATGAVAGHWSPTRGGAGSSPSMGLHFQVATAWGWLESGYDIAHQTWMGTNHRKGGWQGGWGCWYKTDPVCLALSSYIPSTFTFSGDKMSTESYNLDH